MPVAGFSSRVWIGLAIYCIGAMVTMLNLSYLSPLLRPIGETFGISDATTGQLATLNSLVIFAASVAATPWMDRFGRRTWLRVESGLFIVGALLFAFAPTFPVLVVGRIISALGCAVIMANCLIGARELFQDSVWRNRAIGLIVSATTVAFVIGLPVITQLEATFNWRVAVAAVAVPGVLLFLGSFVLPDRPIVAPQPHTSTSLLASFRAVLGDARTRAILIVLGLNLGLYSGWLVFFGAYVTQEFALTAAVLSTIYFLSGITEFAANNLTPPLLRRVDAIPALQVMLGVAGAALLLTGIAVVSVPGALIAAIVILNGTSAAYIACNALLLEGEHSHPGAVMSVASSSIGIGAAAGPLITGWALATSGSFEVAYRFLGLFAPLAMLVLWLGTRSRRTETAPAS